MGMTVFFRLVKFVSFGFWNMWMYARPISICWSFQFCLLIKNLFTNLLKKFVSSGKVWIVRKSVDRFRDRLKKSRSFCWSFEEVSLVSPILKKCRSFSWSSEKVSFVLLNVWKSGNLSKNFCWTSFQLWPTNLNFRSKVVFIVEFTLH